MKVLEHLAAEEIGIFAQKNNTKTEYSTYIHKLPQILVETNAIAAVYLLDVLIAP